MAGSSTPQKFLVPRTWRRHVRSGVLHTLSLATSALTAAWARAASRSTPQRQQAEIDRLRTELAHLREEMEIKDSRWHRHSPRRRPHYGPVQRMRILRLRAARGWTVAQTAERFLVTEMTIENWMRRLDEAGEAALVRMEEPVNKYPDFVAYLVRHLKVLSPSLGKVRIAQMLARAGLQISASTVRRMLKRDLTPMDVEAVMPVEDHARRIRARRPNEVWHADLTVVPTAAGLWIPGPPHARVQRWPFCWWVAVAVDHVSRKLVGSEVFKRRPTSVQVCSVLDRAIRTAGTAPRTIVTDKGKEFFCWPFRSWCRERGIRTRFGAVGQHGSITIVERFIRSLKSECTRRILVPFRTEAMRRELEHYAAWYDEHRPHSGLEGRTPGEVWRGDPPAADRPRFEPRVRWPNAVGEMRGRRGARLKLVLRHVDGRRHLPIVGIEQVA